MNVVSRFEANLLRILHCLLGHAPAAQAVPLLLQRTPAPPCLSATAVGLVEDALAKGCTLLLTREGGWRKVRHVRGETVSDGRLWERTLPADLGLAFSQHTLAFLIWLTAEDPRAQETAWQLPLAELQPGDWLLFFSAHRVLREETELTGWCRDQAIFARNALCRLAYPEDFPAIGPDYRPWLEGVGGCILEALQPLLERRWVRLESSKGAVTDWQALQALGAAQEEVLEDFLCEAERAGRLDLAGFLLGTAARLLTPQARPHMWVSDAVRGAPPRMADRVAMQNAALALVRQVERFHDWEQQARSVGYLDEGYAASQLTKDSWERHGGARLHDRAQAIIRELDPLRVPAEGRS